MADGAITVTFDEYTSAKLVERAKAMGISPEELAILAVDNQIFDYGDFQWAEGGDPRAAVSEPLVEEELRDWKEVRPELEAYLGEKLKAQR